MAFGMMTFLTSCDKDQIEEIDSFDYIEEMGLRVPGDENGKDRLGKKRPHCFDLVFPVTIAIPNSTSEVANDAEELKEILMTWKQNNPGPQAERPEFVYPVDVVLKKDGSTFTLNNKEEMMELAKTCVRPKKHRKFPLLMERMDSCFTVNYPINVIFPDGSTEEVNDREELKTIFMTWKENNPGHQEEHPEISFPIEITLANGDVVVLEDMSGLSPIIKDCFPNRPNRPKGKRGLFFLAKGLEDCFTITYPLEVELPDGTVESGADREEVIAIFKTWHENNQGAGNGKPQIVFPVEVTLADGTVKSIADMKQMYALVKFCKK
jgi:hypothetical protein